MVNKATTTVKKDSLSKLKDLLDRGININTKDTNGRTLLHHAVSNNEYEVVKCLLENGADILITNDKGNTALHIAVLNKDNAMVNVIFENVTRDKLKKLLDPKIKTTKNSALHLAVKSNCYENVSIFLEYGANYEIRNNAGKKPVDLASSQDLGQLLQIIDASFVKAKIGDEQLVHDLAEFNWYDSTSVLNCRNNEGHTIIQVLILNEHFELVTHLLEWRCNRPIDGFLIFDDPTRKTEIESLITITRACRDFWDQQREIITSINSGIERCRPEQFRIIADHAGKIASQGLEKAHEVLLAYRKYEGKERTLTVNPAMKSLQEILEVLGFNPEQIYIVMGDDASYYQKIPSKFKENIGHLINFMNCMVDATLAYLLRCIYTIQIFDAIKTNDVKKVQDWLERGGMVNCVDPHHQTALNYAVERGNETIIRLLLESHAEVACDGATSPIFLAIDNGNAKILELLLENVDTSEIVDFIDLRLQSGGTALHKAAEEGRLDFVKILLKFGATYWVFDQEKRTPMDVSTNEDVSVFLKIIDECFHDAKNGDIELVQKLKAMDNNEFMAVAGAKNHQGHTLAVVAAKANAKNLAIIILKMLKEAKQDEK